MAASAGSNTGQRNRRGKPGDTAPTGKPAARRLLKAGVGLILLGVLGFLFMRSVRGTRAEPYTVARDTMRPWHLALDVGGRPDDPMLVLEPPAALPGALFGQLFKRSMESMSSPSVSGIPLLLQGEFARLLASQPSFTPQALLSAARDAGLEGAPPQPRCLAHRRAGDGGPGTADPDRRVERRDREQVYFVLFDAPAFATFRQRMAKLVNHGIGAAELPSSFDPAALSPALLLALVESTADHWLPLHPDPKVDCVAPIVIADAPP
jgi:hypothetical protein